MSGTRADASQDHPHALQCAAINRPLAERCHRTGRPRRTWLRTFKLDLRPGNISLHLAWRRAVRNTVVSGIKSWNGMI